MSDSFVTVRNEIDRSIKALSKARELLFDEIEPLMTVEEIAVYWNCTIQHVRNVLSNNYFRGKTRRIGGIVRVRREDVFSYGVDEES